MQVKFLIAWMDTHAAMPGEKHLFTWVCFDYKNNQIVAERSNMEAPKQGSYPTFLLGEPTPRADAQGNTWQYFDNLNETIVCLINDAADQGSAAPPKSKLRLFQFDPFIDTREVSLMQNVQHVYATPIR